MNGYGDAQCPPYRRVTGELCTFDFGQGWKAVIIPHTEVEAIITKRSVSQSLGQLEDLLASNEQFLNVKLTGRQQKMLWDLLGEPHEVGLHIPRQAIVRIADAVRFRVQEWTSDLEERDVLGEDLTFTREEKVTASQITYTTINNIGAMHNSSLQQHSSGTQVYNAAAMEDLPALVDALAEAAGKLGLDAGRTRELEVDVATLRVQLASPKPKPGILRDCLGSAKTIIEGAAGSLLASGLLDRITPLLAMLPR